MSQPLPTTLGATRALGVSAGASTLLTLLVNDPRRFQKVALVLPNSWCARNEPELAMTDQTGGCDSGQQPG